MKAMVDFLYPRVVEDEGSRLVGLFLLGHCYGIESLVLQCAKLLLDVAAGEVALSLSGVYR